MSESTTNGEHHSPSDEEALRAAAFGAALSDDERAAALRAGRTPVPPKFILRVSLALALVVVVGTTLEKLLGNVGQPSRAPKTHLVAPVKLAPSLSNLKNGQRGTSLADILGLRSIVNVTAAPFTLTDQHQHAWSLQHYRGQVVVVTFFDTNCQDICPVLGAELRAADTRLQAAGVNATFAVVNTNPYVNTALPNPPALQQTGLTNSPNIFFLNGPLKTLDQVWSNYGVQIRVAKSGRIAHNNVLYFVSPKGKLNALAVPFGNENHLGHYLLSGIEINRFAQGIAQVVTNLDHA